MRTAGAKGDKSNASARWQRLLQRVAPASLLAFLLAAVLVPVFADETGWRLQERAWIDGGFDVAYSDVCGPNSVARAPVFMLPVRAFSAVVNLHLADPLFIRIEGVLCALGWLALFWILTAQVVPGARRRSDVRTLSCAILGMGFLPLMMVVSRPEQPHILTATLAIVIALARWPAGTVMARTWAKVLVIVVLDAIALSYHIKGVLYSLIFLACVLACSRRRRDWPVKLVAVGVILVLTAIALQYWFKNHGLLAEEGIGATGLFRIGRDIKDFAARGEWVWEIRVIQHGLSLDGVIWINAHTKKILAFGPKS